MYVYAPPREGSALAQKVSAFRHLESAHYSLRTDLPPDEARKALVRAERTREVVLAFFPAAVLPSAREPLVVLRSLEDFVRLRRTALVVEGPEEMLVVPADPEELGSGLIARSLVTRLLPTAPAWLQAGLSHHLGSIQVKADARGTFAHVGEPDPGLAARIQREGGLDLARALTMRRCELDRVPEAERATFEASAWLLVQTMAADQPEGLHALLGKLSAGEPAPKAIAAVLGPDGAGALAPRAMALLGRNELAASRVPLGPEPEVLADRKMPPAEAHALRALLHLSSLLHPVPALQLQRAQVSTDFARRLDPKNASVRVVAARLATGSAGAVPIAREGTNAAPDDWRTWWMLARALEDRTEDAAEWQAAAKRAATRGAAHGAALLLGARAALAAGDAKQAERLAAQAAWRLPASPAPFAALSEASQRLGKCEATARAARAALERSALCDDEEAWGKERGRVEALEAKCAPVPPPVDGGVRDAVPGRDAGA